MGIQKLFKDNRQIIGLAIVVLVVVGIVWGIQRFSEIQETYREYVDNILEDDEVDNGNKEVHEETETQVTEELDIDYDKLQKDFDNIEFFDD